jgi:chaperonin GroES
MSIRPLHDYVVIERKEPEETVKGGIILTGAAQEKPVVAEVTEVGPGVLADGTKVEMPVKPGDKVLVTKYGGTEFTIDGRKVSIIKQSDILAVVE